MHRAAARLLIVALLGTSPRASAVELRWEPVPAPAGLERATALALDASGGRLAAGGERGAALGPLAGPLERVLARGPIRALVFARGALWAAGEAGLFSLEAGAAARPVDLAPGEAARDVRDLDVLGDQLAAATAAGVFASEASGRWRRVPGLPSGEASRVLWRAPAGGPPELWAVIGGSLWVAAAGDAARRIPLPGAASGEGALDLARSGGSLLVLLPRALAELGEDGRWRSHDLALPPGAAAGRLRAGVGGFWIASDAGLLRAEALAGPWRRAAPPVGHDPVWAIAAVGDAVAVATGTGLWRAAGAAVSHSAAPAAAPSAPDARSDPPVRAVHRAALRHLELEPWRMHALARAAGRRGWLPELKLRVDRDRFRDRALDYDQAFVSGETRLLVDRDRRRGSDYGAAVELSWDLGDTVFHPDRIDVSREARLVAQLRDDVLDEINQLYFERQRVLAALRAPPPDVGPELLRLRAAELAAGIDAWTGGWFSAQIEGPGVPPS